MTQMQEHVLCETQYVAPGPEWRVQLQEIESHIFQAEKNSNFSYLPLAKYIFLNARNKVDHNNPIYCNIILK